MLLGADLALTNLGMQAADPDTQIALSDSQITTVGNTVTITLAAGELTDGVYELTVSSATDLAGNSVDGDGDGAASSSPWTGCGEDAIASITDRITSGWPLRRDWSRISIAAGTFIAMSSSAAWRRVSARMSCEGFRTVRPKTSICRRWREVSWSSGRPTVAGAAGSSGFGWSDGPQPTAIVALMDTPQAASDRQPGNRRVRSRIVDMIDGDIGTRVLGCVLSYRLHDAEGRYETDDKPE